MRARTGVGSRAISFICAACCEQDHEHCVGRQSCDCQHRPPGPVEPATGPAGE